MPLKDFLLDGIVPRQKKKDLYHSIQSAKIGKEEKSFGFLHIQHTECVTDLD
jgi:hypothetical protein